MILRFVYDELVTVTTKTLNNISCTCIVRMSPDKTKSCVCDNIYTNTQITQTLYGMSPW